MATSEYNTRPRTRSQFLAFLGRSGVGVALAVLLFTALIWLRLRLVTDVPRQAYAVPEAGQVQPDADAPDRDHRAGDASPSR